MESFTVFLEGTWSFYCSMEANSKEEAIEQLKGELDLQKGPIDLYHKNQWIKGEEDTVKKRICVINLETGSLDPYHQSQDYEDHKDMARVKLTKEQVRELFN